MTVKDDVNTNGVDMKKIQSQQGVGREESRAIERKMRRQPKTDLSEGLLGQGLNRDPDDMTGVDSKHTKDLFEE